VPWPGMSRVSARATFMVTSSASSMPFNEPPLAMSMKG
jgi:hypothetical protein